MKIIKIIILKPWYLICIYYIIGQLALSMFDFLSYGYGRLTVKYRVITYQLLKYNWNMLKSGKGEKPDKYTKGYIIYMSLYFIPVLIIELLLLITVVCSLKAILGSIC